MKRISFVGVPHEVQLDGQELFFAHVYLHGRPPVRRYFLDLIGLVRSINFAKVFDLTQPPERVADGYWAIDARRAITTLRQ